MTLERTALAAPAREPLPPLPPEPSVAPLPDVSRCCLMARNHGRPCPGREGQPESRSAIAELVEPLLVESEAVGELVRDRHLDLAAQRPLVVPEVLDQRSTEERDERRQHPGGVVAELGALEQAVQVVLALRRLVLDGDRDLGEVRPEPAGKLVQRLLDERLEALRGDAAGHGA